MNLHEIQDHFYHLCFDDTWPEVENRRTIYRRLVHNGIRASIANALPIFFAILGPRREKEVLRDFLHQAKPQSRFYRDIPKDFVSFLRNSHSAIIQEYLFLLELADFEYCDYDLIFQEAPSIPSHALDKLLEDTRPILNPNLYLRNYRYPVHEIDQHTVPASVSPRDTWLVISRHPNTWKITSVTLDAAAVALFCTLRDHPERTLAESMDSSFPLDVFKQFLDRRIILAMV